MPAKKNVLVVGFGAVGVIYSYALKAAGKVNVTCIARGNYEATKANGIFIRSRKYGNFPNWRPDRCEKLFLFLPSANSLTSTGLEVFRSVADAADRPYSHVIIATKSLPEITPLSSVLGPLLQSEWKLPVFVLLQNGIGIETGLYNDVQRLRKEVPKIITTAVWIGSNLLDGNTIEHSHPERLVMGMYRPAFSSDVVNSPEEKAILEEFKNLFQGVDSPMLIVDEIQRVKFEKNFWNAAFGTCSALTRYTLPAFFREELVENQVIPQIRAMMQEILAIGRAMGFSEEALPSSVIESTIATTATLHKAPDSVHKASTLIDLENGRPMELEVLLGELVRKAKELNVATPVSVVGDNDLYTALLSDRQFTEIRYGIFSTICRPASTI